MRDLFKKFFEKMKGLDQTKKISMVYTKLVGKKPDPLLTLDRKLTRVLYELEFGKKSKETEKVLTGRKQFKVPFKWNSIMKKSKKKRNLILVFYLNIKNEIEPPRLHPIYSGNMVIIKNRPYEVDPRAFWSLGKYKCLLIKEIDRRPVSNLDYSEIRARGDATDSDEFLIKAAMKAMYGGVKKQLGKGGLIAIGILVLVVIGFLFMTNKGA